MIIDEVDHQLLLGLLISHRSLGAPGPLPSDPDNSPASPPRREVFNSGDHSASVMLWRARVVPVACW